MTLTKDHPQHVYEDGKCRFCPTESSSAEAGVDVTDENMKGPCVACRMNVGHYILCEYGINCRCGCLVSITPPKVTL